MLVADLCTHYHMQRTSEGSVFGAVGLCFFVCAWFISLEPLDLCQIYMEDVFGPSLGRVWRLWSKVKVTSVKNSIFRPFRWPACGLCLV